MSRKSGYYITATSDICYIELIILNVYSGIDIECDEKTKIYTLPFSSN